MLVAQARGLLSCLLTSIPGPGRATAALLWMPLSFRWVLSAAQGLGTPGGTKHSYLCPGSCGGVRPRCSPPCEEAGMALRPVLVSTWAYPAGSRPPYVFCAEATRASAPTARSPRLSEGRAVSLQVRAGAGPAPCPLLSPAHASSGNIPLSLSKSPLPFVILPLLCPVTATGMDSSAPGGAGQGPLGRLGQGGGSQALAWS